MSSVLARVLGSMVAAGSVMAVCGAGGIIMAMHSGSTGNDLAELQAVPSGIILGIGGLMALAGGVGLLLRWTNRRWPHDEPRWPDQESRDRRDPPNLLP